MTEASLGEEEQRVIRQLDPELEEHSALSLAAFDFLQDLLCLTPQINMEDMSPSLKVSTSLLARLVNDLRCIALLAHRGYAVQACSLAASMYEVAFAVMSIGSDDELAQKWINHDDPTRSYRDVWTMTRDGLSKLGIPDEQVAIEYRVYSQLCMARHANPLFQMEHSFRVLDEGTVSPLAGPDSSESLRAAQYSMLRSTSLAFLAGTSFAKEHLERRLPAQQVSELIDKIKSVGTMKKALEEKAKSRWGTEDPFPGKWRQQQSKPQATGVINVAEAELKLIERRFGSDGWEYFAERAGPYDGVYWWFVWRVPARQTSGVGELIGGVMNRAKSAEEAEDAARALLDRVIP